MPEKRIFAKAGHVCMMCGFKATTKNKYRELQDHLVRRHFQDRIKAALPTRRPFMCPDHSCNVEGKDWQALMRHYTGKHGVLEAYLKEFLASQMEYKENLHFKSLPPTNKIGCRRKRHKRHSSGDQDPTEAEDSTEDPPVQTLPPPLPAIASPPLQQLPPALEPVTTVTGPTSYDSSPATSIAASSEESQTQFQTGSPALSADSETILQLDDSDPADCPPTHLALVLKRRKVNKDGLEEDSHEETYAFVDLKYFQPLSANQYVMKSQIIDPSLLALQTTSAIQHPHLFHHHQPPSQQPHTHEAADPASIPPTSSTTPIGSSQPAMAAYSANNGGCFFVDSSTHGGASQSYFESFPTQPEEAVAAQYSPNSAETVVSSGSSPAPCSASTIYIPADPATFTLAPRPHDPAHQPQDQCYDQVVPNQGGVTACAGEVEVSTTLVQYEDEGQPPILMEVPISNGGPVATVSIDPKGLNRGCSKVVVETVKSIPMDAGGCVTATTTEASAGGHYELMSHGMDGMKEIDFAMF